MNLGLDVNTEFIAYAFTDGSKVVTMGTIPFKGAGPHIARAKDRLPHLVGAVKSLDGARMDSGTGTEWLRSAISVRIEEPVIGKGARASMLVGLFNGGVYALLDSMGYPVFLIHPSTWKANLRAQLGTPTAISSKQDVTMALNDIPGLMTIIKRHNKGVQQDLIDAVGLALGGE